MESDNRSKEESKSWYSVGRFMGFTKLFEKWGLSFDGTDSKTEAERFIRRLGECKYSVRVSECDLLQAIPTVLSRATADWWSAEQNEIATWREFKKVVRARLIGRLDSDDLMVSLRQRTQAKSLRQRTQAKSISAFLTAFTLKLKSFRRPPNERTQRLSTKICCPSIGGIWYTCQFVTSPTLRNMGMSSLTVRDKKEWVLTGRNSARAKTRNVAAVECNVIKGVRSKPESCSRLCFRSRSGSPTVDIKHRSPEM